MSRNPYLDEIRSRSRLEDLATEYLATLAVAHELHEMNRLTAAVNAPLRFAASVQAPISPEDLRSQKVMVLPEEEEDGDARIAAAARRWAGAYGARNVPGKAAAHYLASNELLEAVRQEDER